MARAYDVGGTGMQYVRRMALVLAALVFVSGISPALANVAPAQQPAGTVLVSGGAPAAATVSHAAPAAAPPAGEDDSDDDVLIPEWAFILTKATTFELASSAMEAAIFVAFFGGGGGAAGTVFVVTLVSAFAIYVVHEMVWEAALPPEADRENPTIVGARATTSRILSLIRSFVAASLIGGAHGGASTIFAVVVSAADTVLFITHDLIFARLHKWIYD